MASGFLDKAYGVDGADETQRLYDEWSKSYDAEVSENGYVTPKRIAQALAGVINDPSEPILDYGCGTGISGFELRSAGFTHIHGADPSPNMLKGAHSKGVYTRLTTLEIDKPPPFETGDFKIITAIGVIGTGAAPLSLFDELMALLEPGGIFAFSFNDHALAEPEYPAKVKSWAERGAKVHVEEYGDHLPGVDLKSMIYIIEKA